MTMNHSPRISRRRSIALVCVSSLSLAACGGGGADGPPTLRVFADLGAARLAPAEMSSVDAMTMLANMKFVLAADLPALDSAAPAYVIQPGEPSASEVETLLGIFGIEGPLEPQPIQSGGGYFAGTGDGTDPALYVSGDALQYWTYSPPWDETSMNPACFDMSEIETVAPPTPVTDSIPVADTEAPQPDGEEEVLEDPCPDDGVPVDVPTEDEAVEMFADFMSDIGIDIESLDLEIFTDAYGASVTGFLLIDGVRSPLTWSVSYGEGGRISWAGGVLAEPTKLADYERIGTDAALDRLNEQQSSMVAGISGGAADAAATGQGDPIVVDVIEVEDELVMLNGVDGSVYLVPGYAFLADTDEMGFEPRYTVSAIPDSYVEVEESPAPSEGESTDAGATDGAESEVDEPGMDGEPMEEISSDEANTLLGMSEEEATAAAQANGWVVRIAARDGEQFALTMDYNYTRVNLTVDNGVVTDVFVG